MYNKENETHDNDGDQYKTMGVPRGENGYLLSPGDWE